MNWRSIDAFFRDCLHGESAALIHHCLSHSHVSYLKKTSLTKQLLKLLIHHFLLLVAWCGSRLKTRMRP